ncbi:MAG: hypothetical protein R3E68_14105 [Burkholderiaceae bacterium]
MSIVLEMVRRLVDVTVDPEVEVVVVKRRRQGSARSACAVAGLTGPRGRRPSALTHTAPPAASSPVAPTMMRMSPFWNR